MDKHLNLPEDAEGEFLVGYADVDAGLIWIGDPCYIIPSKHDDGSKKLDWHKDICDNILGKQGRENERLSVGPNTYLDPWDIEQSARSTKFMQESGHPDFIQEPIPRDALNGLVWEPLKHGHGGSGRGLAISSGYGDGSYPVYVTIKDGRVAEARIVFFADEEDSND